MRGTNFNCTPCRVHLLKAFVGCVLLAGSTLHGLPIGFSHNQGSLDYKELVNQRSTVYHDARSQNEARLISESIEKALPVLEVWMNKERRNNLPVITTSVAQGASFANFVTDTIELQTMGQGTRDLTWHELTHTMTYTHLENALGPAGAILHLIWMPTWFLEGLAEALSVSEGSDLQAGYERFHALTKKWPTFERLHSLYNVGNIAVQGYNTSGAWVSYLLRTYGANTLPLILAQFYDNSMPWWWPWSALPWSPYLPLDDALERFTGKKSKALWKEYISAAETYWIQHTKGPLLYKNPGLRKLWRLFQRSQQVGDELTVDILENGTIQTRYIDFDPQTGWATGYQPTIVNERPKDWKKRIQLKNARVAVSSFRKEFGHAEGFKISVISEEKDQEKEFYKSTGQLITSGLTKNKFFWLEKRQELTLICSANKSDFTNHGAEKKIRCFQSWKQPARVQFLGKKISAAQGVSELWLSVDTQTIKGDHHRVVIIDPEKESISRSFVPSHGGRPISVAFAGKNIWQVTGERQRRTLRQISPDGRCLSVRYLEDTPYQIHGFSDGTIALGLVSGLYSTIIKLNPLQLPKTSCYQARPATSPLLEYFRSKQTLTFKESMKQSSLWDTTASDLYDQTSEISKAPPLGSQIDQNKTSPAKWRPRPVFGVPWIAADAMGYNFGLLSVPLMDHMQNETIRMTALWGWESRYPSTQISFSSTRFKPRVNVDLFRYQAWNGVYATSSGSLSSSYVDEKGGKIALTYIAANHRTNLQAHIKTSVVTPYIGPILRQGHLRQLGLQVGTSQPLGNYSYSAQLRILSTPAVLNENFDFNQLGFSTSLSRRFSWRNAHANLGLSGGRTRGTKRRLLQEVYRPLKTFIPGSGGGFNNVNLPIVGSGGLFTGHFGDSKFRTSVNLTFPLIESIDQLVRVLYLQSLDFSAFVNYGAAWNGDDIPKSEDWIGAHGYNVDLLMDIKGVNFNLGVGTGQVFDQEFETYATFGFDAIL